MHADPTIQGNHDMSEVPPHDGAGRLHHDVIGPTNFKPPCKGKFIAPSKVNKRNERDANIGWHLHATLAAKHGRCCKRSPNEGERAKGENNEKHNHYKTQTYIYI